MGVLLREVVALLRRPSAGPAVRRSPSCRCSTPTSPSGSGAGSAARSWTRSSAYWQQRARRRCRRCWSCPPTARARPCRPSAAPPRRRSARRPARRTLCAACAGARESRRSWPCSRPSQVLLARYAGQEDLLVGTPIAGRNRRGDRGPDRLLRQHPGAALGSVRRPELRASCWSGCARRRSRPYAHQDLPFERLVEELRPSATWRHRRSSR